MRPTLLQSGNKVYPKRVDLILFFLCIVNYIRNIRKEEISTIESAVEDFISIFRLSIEYFLFIDMATGGIIDIGIITAINDTLGFDVSIPTSCSIIAPTENKYSAFPSFKKKREDPVILDLLCPITSPD